MKISLHSILNFLKERWPYYAALLACAFITLLIFFNHGTNLLDSDMSAEMILGRLLKNEGGILAKNWCYSTELRVIASQLVYKLFFYFSDSWLWVRLLSTAFMLLTLAVSYCFFAERWNLGKTGILCGLVLLLPFSAEYARYVIWGAYYQPYLVFMFLALGLAVPFKSASLSKASLYIGAALAFLAGLSGIRAAVMIYVPFMLTAAGFVISRLLTEGKRTAEPENTDKLRYFCKSAAFALSGGLIGAAVNAGILSHAYSFARYGGIKLIDVIPSLFFDFAFRSFSSVLGYTGFGLSLNADVFRGIFAAVCFILLLAACLRFAELDFEGRFIVGFTVVGFLFNALVCTVTCFLEVRYTLPSLMMLAPTAAVILNCLAREGLRTLKVLITGLLCLCLSVQVIAFAKKPSLDYETGKRTDKFSFAYNSDFIFKNQIVAPEAFKEAVEFLRRNKYKKGFATFWHSDIITELSDGRIEMWTLESDSASIGDWTAMRKYAWLQDKRHLTKDPQGKVFLLLNRKELKYDRARLYTDEKHLIFKNKELAVYGYRSAEAMYNNLCGKRLNGIMKVKRSGGSIRKCGSGLIELKRGEKLSGPHINVCRERYELEIDCGGAGVSGRGAIVFGSKRQRKGFKLHDGLNRISLDLRDSRPEWRLEIVNKSSAPLKIKSIALKKRNKNAKNS